jgi:hypothetical protein
MHKENAAPVAKDSQLNVSTLAAIGALACIAADMVHEALGHGTASLLMSDPILSLSTVAIQNASPSRFVSAAGTTANLIVGVLSLLFLRRVRRLTPSAYFLWVFGAFNLFNVGYLVASACMSSGDWAAVISGLSPSWLWRCVLGLVGIIFYFLSLRWIASFAIDFVNHRQVAIGDSRRGADGRLHFQPNKPQSHTGVWNRCLVRSELRLSIPAAHHRPEYHLPWRWRGPDSIQRLVVGREYLDLGALHRDPRARN